MAPARAWSLAVVLLFGAVTPALADWTADDITQTGVRPEEIASDAEFWYWKLAYFGAAPPSDRPITDFPGTMLLPPRGAPLFQGLSFGAAVSEPEIGSGRPGYRVDLGAAQAGSRVSFVGALGREGFERAADRRAVPGCETTAPYCASLPHGADLPAEERFYDLAVAGRPAIVGHTSCCNGEAWQVTWYDADTDTTYGVILHGTAAAQLGAAGLDPGNLAQARMVVDAAAILVRVRIPRAPLSAQAVAEAMRSCLTIREIRTEDTPLGQSLALDVEGHPVPASVDTIRVGGGPRVEHYRHHQDPRVAIVFRPLPFGSPPPAPPEALRASREQIRSCFQSIG